VDERDGWKVHFADTMRGGQYLSHPRMAESHAKEAPERVRELKAWGALFDRTADGHILQRNFGGHRYPRLAHVGDRTGLEMIRTLQDHGIHQGIDFHPRDGHDAYDWLRQAMAHYEKAEAIRPAANDDTILR
jgi:succinate dehydrogenase / fumarate reductase flavoprotein subunit